MQSAATEPAPWPWWREFWYKNFLGILPFDFKTPRGYKIQCRRRYEIRMCEKIFSCSQYPLDRLNHPVRTVLDVGANIGVFSMYSADAFSASIKKIVSVEPFIPNVRRLEATARRNGLDGVIQVVHAAAGEQSGHAELLIADSHYSNSILAAKVKTPNATQPVTVITLDALRRERSLGEIDLLKIDVEGVELGVLKAAGETLDATRALIIECHKGFCSFGDLKKALAPHGLFPMPGTETADDAFGDYCFIRRS